LIFPAVFNRVGWAILLGSAAVLALWISAMVVVTRRFHRRREMLHSWAVSEGLRIGRAWLVGRLHGLPAALIRGPGALINVYVYRFHGTRTDGRTCSGYVRFPTLPGTYAPPVLAVFDETGPSGLASSEGMP
jgi:hypothetical protein